MRIDAFYSDPHFGHKNIIGFCQRPFANVGEMREEMVARYNQEVSPHATVLWLGDCFMYHSQTEARSLLRRMNGTKILVSGNHDKGDAWMAGAGFSLVIRDWATLQIAGHPARACHFPYRMDHPADQRFLHLRPERRKGEILLHGHTHDPVKRRGHQIHVGVDAWDYAPAPLAEVEALVRKVFHGE